MRLIYLATGFRNGVNDDGTVALPFQRVATALRNVGWQLTFDWTKHNVQSIAKAGSVAEFNGVMDADVVGLLLPGGRGAHWECGIASATDTPVVILAEKDEDLYDGDRYACLFYNLPNVYVVRTLTDFVQTINLLIPEEDDDR